MIKRIITACILIPFALLLVFYPSAPDFLLFTILATLWGFWEWSSFMPFSRKRYRFVYVLLAAILLVGALNIPVDIIFYVALGWWILAFFLIIFYPRSMQFNFAKGKLCRGLIGFLVLIPCCIAINYIRNEEAGMIRLLFLFILIWGADSAAYFAGKKWGKHRLAPLVSPGKTWEGCIGAFIFVLLLTLGTLWYATVSLSFWPWAILLTTLTLIFSIIGDLLESTMKREAGVKDSGRFLPGHGGLLDRIDSLTAAAPIFTLGALWLGAHVE